MVRRFVATLAAILIPLAATASAQEEMNSKTTRSKILA